MRPKKVEERYNYIKIKRLKYGYLFFGYKKFSLGVKIDFI